jgi:tetratricopeptide (TPR) repeat protein
VLVSDAAAIQVPPSITSLLAARLDRLRPSERVVIERGAVVGGVFFRGAVEALTPDEVKAEVGASLSRLTGKELIAPHESTFAGQEAFRFAHILIRDAAYHGLLKRTRAELHERFVDWLETVAPDRSREFEEIRGYHLEQAYLIGVQLGVVGEHAAAVGQRGAEYLSSAGSRASARGDMPAAANLLQRAASLLPAGDARRPRLLLEAGDACVEIGDFLIADGLLRTASEEAEQLGDTVLQLTARLAYLRLRYTMDPETTEPIVRKEAAEAIEQLEELGGQEALARAYRLLAQVNFTACRWAAVEEAAEKMTEHARLAGDKTLETRLLASQAMAALYGPTPVPAAEERCRALLARAVDDRRTHAIMLCVNSHLAAMRGSFDEARDLYRTSRAVLEELGWKFHAALTSLDSGAVEMLAGDPVAAEAELRRDLETLQAMGDRDYMPTTAALLAEALYEQERLDEALALATLSRESAAPGDVTSQFLWRCVLAKVLAAGEAQSEALSTVREAVALTETTEEPDSQGLALMDLGTVLAAIGRPEAAIAPLNDAIDRFNAKGNLVSSRRAADAIVELGGSVTSPLP